MSLTVPEQSRRQRLIEMLRQDSVLPAEIEPRLHTIVSRPKVALLTGVTGFLGRYVLRSLIEQTGLQIVCLVRASDDRRARERVHSVLRQVLEDSVAAPSRVTVQRGDIDQSSFGMPDAMFNALAGRVDTVYHCAGAVNWRRSYPQLRQSNTLGTREVLRFCTAGKTKPILFVSTIAVCFARNHSETVTEVTDMTRYTLDLPLGYAQSKAVAEQLLRQAADRGLPVRILRPALLSGDTRTGAVNPDDLLAALVQGCTRSALAADANWQLDCVPVDFVADVITRLPVKPAFQVLHLAHQEPRPWREFVLWMNLYGYPVKLTTPEQWIRAVFSNIGVAGAQLFAYRHFFGGNAHMAQAPYECYLGLQQQRVTQHVSRRVLAEAGLRMPPLDACLVHHYLDGYRSVGVLSAPSCKPPVTASMPQSVVSMVQGFRQNPTEKVVRIEPVPIDSNQGILNDISVARVGPTVGIRRYELTLVDRFSKRQQNAVVKTKAKDSVIESLVVDIARQCDPGLGETFSRHRYDLGLRDSHERELAMYEIDDFRLRAFMPHCHGVFRNPDDELWSLALECVNDARSAPAHTKDRIWTNAHIGRVVHGLASIQSTQRDSLDALIRSGVLCRQRTTTEMVASQPLWEALATYSAQAFRTMHPGMPSVQIQLVSDLAQWWPSISEHPVTLIHNDFNPRNLIMRESADGLRLCAYDWELAEIGLPQRDIAEFLCFVARGRARDLSWVEQVVQEHRVAFSRQCEISTDPMHWRRGFALALRQFVVMRLPMYALIERFRPQHYLPGVVQSAFDLLKLSRHWIDIPTK